MKAWLIVLAACGGGTTAAPKEQKPAVVAPSECQTVAGHLADIVLAMKDPPKIDRATILSVVGTHCEADGWSADLKKCLAARTAASAEDDCTKFLTEEQNQKLTADLIARLPKADVQGEDPDVPAESNDPCEGGE